MSKDIDIKQVPAFPINMSGPCTFAGIDIPEGAKVEWGGMALRDYFAAKAMQGYCAREVAIEQSFADIAKDA